MLDKLYDISIFVTSWIGIILGIIFAVVIIIAIIRYIIDRSDNVKRLKKIEDNARMQEFDVVFMKEGLIKLRKDLNRFDRSIFDCRDIKEETKEFLWDGLRPLYEHLHDIDESLERFEEVASDYYWRTETIIVKTKNDF